MNSDIALIQFREDREMASQELECVARDLGINEEQITVYNATKQDLSSIKVENFSAFIFGGSGDISLSDGTEVVKTIKNNIKILILRVVEFDVPSLFICLGYHLFSDYLGESVTKNPKQSESGTTKVYLTSNAMSDALFSGIKKQLIVQEAHHDSIQNLPKAAVLLAENPRCPIQAYRVKKNIYAMQFHPELQKKDMLFRLNHYSEKYETDKSKFKESVETLKIMKNFVKIYQKKSKK